MTETDLANLALGKIGGAGEANNGNAFIASIADTDKVSSWCRFSLPRVRRKVIIELATAECPFRETIRFAGLGAALDTTPEIGGYGYAFNVPGDCLEVVSQFDETNIAVRNHPTDYQTRTAVKYQWETVANAEGNGKILLTNTLSNEDGDSAFIEYVIDITNVGAFSEGMIDAIAYLLASELCPVIGLGEEVSTRMLGKYLEIAVPNAQKANQRGFDSTARTIPDLSGGRSKVLPSRDGSIGYTAI